MPKHKDQQLCKILLLSVFPKIYLKKQTQVIYALAVNILMFSDILLLLFLRFSQFHENKNELQIESICCWHHLICNQNNFSYY